MNESTHAAVTFGCEKYISVLLQRDHSSHNILYDENNKSNSYIEITRKPNLKARIVSTSTSPMMNATIENKENQQPNSNTIKTKNIMHEIGNQYPFRSKNKKNT